MKHSASPGFRPIQYAALQQRAHVVDLVVDLAVDIHARAAEDLVEDQACL